MKKKRLKPDSRRYLSVFLYSQSHGVLDYRHNSDDNNLVFFEI